MQKKLINKTLFASLLITSTLLVSGCNHSNSPVPIAKVEAKFKNDFTQEEIMEAITEAAKDHGWDFVEPSVNSDTRIFNLKKSFKKRELVDNPRGRRWIKTTVHNDILIAVTIGEKSLDISLAHDSENHLSNNYYKEDFNVHLKELEKAIYFELLPPVL